MENKRVRKVVITGAGAVSPYGLGVAALEKGLVNAENCILPVPELLNMPMIRTKVAARVPEADYSYIPRRERRSMSRMSLYAYTAAKEALKRAGYETAPDNLGFFMGSTLNSISVWLEIAGQCNAGHAELIKTSDFLQIMNHSPQATVAQALKITGMGTGACAACATGLMNIGLAYMAVRSGALTQALCGGTEEYHPLFSACFDIMQATSTNFNDRPELSSRPFDQDRTGLVCSEGCGLLFVESEESAQARGAEILAEIAGFAANAETGNIAHPSRQTLAACMRLALQDAQMTPDDVDFLNAHATGTPAGDAAESHAAADVFGSQLKVNSFKGHLGHTMGASGALELVGSLRMMQSGTALPTKNLQNPGADCAPLNYVRVPQTAPINILMKNAFAIGGNNCSLLLRRPL